MKWTGNDERLSKFRQIGKWHPWFAWFPVAVGTETVRGELRVVRAWMETVWRKGMAVEKYDQQLGKCFETKWQYRRRVA